MPRLPLGSDEFVIKVAWEGPEEAESTWEPVSRVFGGATAVMRKELKALRLKWYKKSGTRTIVWVRFWSYCGLGRILNFELLVFGLIESLNFKFFLAWNFCGGR